MGLCESHMSLAAVAASASVAVGSLQGSPPAGGVGGGPGRRLQLCCCGDPQCVGLPVACPERTQPSLPSACLQLSPYRILTATRCLASAPPLLLLVLLLLLGACVAAWLRWRLGVCMRAGWSLRAALTVAAAAGSPRVSSACGERGPRGPSSLWAEAGCCCPLQQRLLLGGLPTLR